MDEQTYEQTLAWAKKQIKINELVGQMTVSQLMEAYYDLTQQMEVSKTPPVMRYKLYDNEVGDYTSQLEMKVSTWNDTQEWKTAHGAKQARAKILSSKKFNYDPNRFEVHIVEIRKSQRIL